MQSYGTIYSRDYNIGLSNLVSYADDPSDLFKIVDLPTLNKNPVCTNLDDNELEASFIDFELKKAYPSTLGASYTIKYTVEVSIQFNGFEKGSF